MLPEGRRRLRHFAWSPAHPPRYSAMLPFTHFGVIAIDEVVARVEVRILGDVLAIGAGAGRDPSRLQSIDDIRDLARRRPRTDYCFEVVFVLLARGERLESRIISQFRFTYCSSQSRPLVVVRTYYRDPLVDGDVEDFLRQVDAFEQSMRRHQRIAIAVALRLAPVHRVFQNPFCQKVHRTLPLAHVDVLTLAGFGAMEQRGDYRERSMHARVRVRIAEPRVHGRKSLIASQSRQTRQRHLRRTVRDIVTIGSGVAVTRQSSHYYIRVYLLHFLVTEAHLFEHARREVVNHDVALFDQAPRRFLRLGMLEIKRQ